VEDDAGEDDLGAVVGGSFGEPGGQAAELFEPVEASLDDVAELVEAGVEGRGRRPGSKAGGLPPALPLAFRRAIWSARSGMVALIFRSRNACRVLGWV